MRHRSQRRKRKRERRCFMKIACRALGLARRLSEMGRRERWQVIGRSERHDSICRRSVQFSRGQAGLEVGSIGAREVGLTGALQSCGQPALHRRQMCLRQRARVNPGGSRLRPPVYVDARACRLDRLPPKTLDVRWGRRSCKETTRACAKVHRRVWLISAPPEQWTYRYVDTVIHPCAM